MKKGLLITFEGCDGSGKSTQIKLLRNFLTRKNRSVIVTREPGGTGISEKIREIILDRENSEMDWKTEALLYAAGRAQHTEETIRPALAAGKIVLCDRFADSTVAYQGYGRDLDIEGMENLNLFATGGLVPDVTFLFDGSPAVLAGRMSRRSPDRLEAAGAEFQEKVRRGYLEIAWKNPERFIIINAEKEISEVRAEIEAVLTPYLV